MTSGLGIARQTLRRLRQEARRWRLEAGEAGWGKPVASPPKLRGAAASTTFRVGVIGAGAQGIAHCQGLSAIKGVKIVGLAEIDPGRLSKAADLLGIPSDARYDDSACMLDRASPLDLICVATTAPTHVQLGRLALASRAKRILLEKPISNSLCDARDFEAECSTAGVPLAINYSRRWMPDYRAIKSCIGRGFIGEPKSVTISVGKGDLAMHASHYFDVSRYILDSEVSWAVSYLDPIEGVNPRGESYQDPSGFSLFVFRNGARSYIDFSADLISKDPFLVIKGTHGQITIDESHLLWTLKSRSRRIWTIPFVENIKSSVTFARVAAEFLSGGPPAAGASDGLAALEMVYAAYLSHLRGHQPVTFPLSNEDTDINLVFP